MHVSAETKQELLNQLVVLTDPKAFKADRYQALDRLREVANLLDDRDTSRLREVAEGSARVHGTVWIDKCGTGYAAYDHEGKMVIDTNLPTRAQVEDRVQQMMPAGGFLEHVSYVSAPMKLKATPTPTLPLRPARRMRAGGS